MNGITSRILRAVLPRIPALLVLLSAGTPWAFPWQSQGSNTHGNYVRRSVEDDKEGLMRNCTPEEHDFPHIFGESQLGRGAIILHFFAVLYLSGCIGYICHSYFVPALERICSEWKIPEDVAGATIMAAGTSLPELFASIMGTFVTQDDTGVGAIVGSAAFNIYAILAICAFIAPKEGVMLSSFPILRDGVYWTVCMLVLIGVVMDGVLHWWESLILSLLYIAYCIVMRFNTQISKITLGLIQKHLTFLNYVGYANVDDKDHIESDSSSCPSPIIPLEESIQEHGTVRSEKKSLSQSQNASSQYGTSDVQAEYIQESLEQKMLEDGEEDDEDADRGCCSVFTFPDSWLMLTLWVFGLPVIAVLCITVPDCRRPGVSRKLYLLTFFLSGLWMAGFCYLLFWDVTIIGSFFGIPSIVMGYTLIAIGTSLPDAVSSGIVSKHGFFDMAVGNINGSNTFEIVVCLGMVWVMKSVSDGFEPVPLITHGFTIVASVLVLSFIISTVALGLHGWVINRRVGVISLMIYIISLIVVTVTENYANRSPACQNGPV